MRSIVDIAKNTFGIILRNKVLYLAVFLLVLIVAFMVLPLAFMAMAAEAGEEQLVGQMQVQLLTVVYALWYSATAAMGMFLGATAISSEAKARTIVTVLSKPVDRWRFLIGKWVGIEVFLSLFLSVGVLLTVGLLLALDVSPSAPFWLGILHTFIVVMVMSSLALLLGTVASPVIAGGATLMLALVTGMIVRWVDAPWTAVRWLAQGYYFLAPAQMPGNLMSQGLSVDLLNPDYGVYFAVIFENVVYGLVLVVLGCVIFTKREVRVR